MDANEPSTKLVSDDEKRSAINAALRKVTEQLGIDPDLVGAKISFGLNSELSPELQHELAKAMGLQMAFQTLETVLPNIRTKDELDQMVQNISAGAEQTSTIAREQLDLIREKLPRRGGPGRKPKLNNQQAKILCEEVLKLVGKKYTVGDALQGISDNSLALVGVHVGKRTLQTMWGKRKEYLS